MIKTAIAFLLGCVLCLFIKPAALPFVSVLAFALLPVAIWQKSVVIISVLLAWLLTSFHILTLWHDRLDVQGRHYDTVVTGQITSLPEIDDHAIRFMFQPDNADLPHRIRLSWYSPPPTPPQAGELWQFSLRLKAPRGLHNPGGFDYEKWLFSQRIGATGYVRKSADNQQLQTATIFSLNHWRQQIQQRLNTLYPDGQFMPLIMGLTIGYRADIDDQHWQVLRQTGTTHLLAISGLHIGLAAAVGFFLWRWLWSLSTRLLYLLPAQRAGAIAGIVSALFYALLAGLSIPTQRALIMVSTVMIALWLNRPVFMSQVLALSLLLVLIVDPLSVLDIGFWLSFSAVALIMLVASQRFPRPPYQWLTIHFWIALGLSPLLILFFGQTSLISPLANLIAVPVVSFLVVPLLLLAVCCLAFNASVSIILLWLADNSLALLWQCLTWLARSEFAIWNIAALSPVFWLVGIIATLLLLLPRGFPAKFWGLLIIPMLITQQPTRPDENSFTLSVLDVGQGLATVIETRQHLLVYDTGAAYASGFDMGEHVVVPFLTARGHDRIDKLVISHSDNDHNGGTASVLKLFSVTEVVSSDTRIHSKTTLCQAGQSWQWDGVQFDIVHPATVAELNDNNRSCVLKVSGRHYSVLLTGDIETAIEQQLVTRQPAASDSDVLVVAHHGSRTSSSATFIDAVSPHYAVFSAGYGNHYGFPAKSVMTRFQQRHVSLLRTDLQGAILFDQSGHPVSWRQQANRIWSSKTTE